MNQDENATYVEPPEELDDDPERNGLNCFLNDVRVCGSDCMAYTTFASESPYLNDQQKHCSAIVGIERLGRYAGGILSLLKNDKADAGRAKKAPPDPKGGG